MAELHATPTEVTAQPIDLLSLIADDRQVVTYRPRWNAFTGGVTQTLFLQQVVFWWARAGRRPFYKFARPCAHRLYKSGDSWQEELAMQRRELENARAGIATRTRGEVAPSSLISYWIDARRVTWYALNEPLLLQHLAALYPTSGAAAQIPFSAELMDETYISGNAPNVHQPDTGLMDETYISGNAPNVHQPDTGLMDETYISSNGRNVQQLMDETYTTANAPNVHPPITESEITQQRSPQTTTAPPPAAAADPRPAILDWIAFDDALTDKERATLDPANLLAWAYWVKLKQADAGSRIHNPVGLVRAQWRKGAQPRLDLLHLARGWLLLSDDARGRLLGRLEWAGAYGIYDPGDPLDDEFPDIPLATAAAVYAATGGQLAPPTLSPAAAEPVCLPDRPTPAGRRVAALPRSVPQTAHAQPTAALWRDTLTELEMQMTRATFNRWLSGTTATLAGDELTVLVANAHAVDSLSNRLDDLITRTVLSLAGRPLTVRYAIRQKAAP